MSVESVRRAKGGGSIAQWLDEHEVEWVFQAAVPLSSIDVEASKRNQARLAQAIDPGIVQRYVLAMESGAQFPALVAWKNVAGRYVLIDGNHRLAAMLQVRRAEANLFVVQTMDPLVIERLTRTANLLNGYGVSPADALEQACYLVEKLNYVPSSAASLCLVPVKKLTDTIRIRKIRTRLGGLRSAKQLSDNAVQALGRIPIDPPLRAAAELVAGAGFSGEETVTLAREICEGTDEGQMLAIVDKVKALPEIRERLMRTAGGRLVIRNEQRRQLFMALTGLNNLLQRYPSAIALGLTVTERKERLPRSWGEVRDRMEQLLHGIDTDA